MLGEGGDPFHTATCCAGTTRSSGSGPAGGLPRLAPPFPSGHRAKAAARSFPDPGQWPGGAAGEDGLCSPGAGRRGRRAPPRLASTPPPGSAVPSRPRESLPAASREEEGKDRRPLPGTARPPLPGAGKRSRPRPPAPAPGKGRWGSGSGSRGRRAALPRCLAPSPGAHHPLPGRGGDWTAGSRGRESAVPGTRGGFPHPPPGNSSPSGLSRGSSCWKRPPPAGRPSPPPPEHGWSDLAGGLSARVPSELFPGREAAISRI